MFLSIRIILLTRKSLSNIFLKKCTHCELRLVNLLEILCWMTAGGLMDMPFISAILGYLSTHHQPRTEEC